MSLVRQMSMRVASKQLDLGTVLLECDCVKKGMSVTGNWRDRYLRLYESKEGGLILAYYKNKSSDTPKGVLHIKPNSKVSELEHHKRDVVMEIQSGGNTFTCSMPDRDVRKRWVDLLREETDNSARSQKTLKGRRLSQKTIDIKDKRVKDLEIKVVSHQRTYSSPTKPSKTDTGKSTTPTKSLKKTFSTNRLRQIRYGFDFGVKDQRSGKWQKVWSKAHTDKEWKQVHKAISKTGLLRLFGSSKGAALKWPDSHLKESDEDKIKTRAFSIELYLYSLLNMTDVSAIRANAAPWVCIVSFPQLHKALDLPIQIAKMFCRIGYQRKIVAFGEDPIPEWSGVPGDFDLDEDVGEFDVISLEKPPVPDRSETNIKKPRTSNTEIKRVESKLNFKPVTVYSGMLYKKPTSGSSFGKGKLRWFSLRRNEENLRNATLEYYKDKSEKKLKGHVLIDETCSIDLGTHYCKGSRWRFCIRNENNVMLEAEAPSEKEFGCWAMHILRYTNMINRLTVVSPRASVAALKASRHSRAALSMSNISVADNNSTATKGNPEPLQISPGADKPLGAPPEVDLEIEDEEHHVDPKGPATANKAKTDGGPYTPIQMAAENDVCPADPDHPVTTDLTDRPNAVARECDLQDSVSTPLPSPGSDAYA